MKVIHGTAILVIGLMLSACASKPAPATSESRPLSSPSPGASAQLAQTTAPTDPAVGATTQPAQAAAPANPAASNIQSQPAQPAPPRVFTLPAGKSLTIYTERDLSSKNDKAGERFVGSLAQPIIDGDWVIAKKGAQVEGVVVAADQGGRVKGRASLSVRLLSLMLADGNKINLSTSSYTAVAKATKAKDATKIGIGAGIGAAIGAIAGGGKGAAIGAGAGAGAGTGVVLATHGDPAVIQSESPLAFKLTAPFSVTKR